MLRKTVNQTYGQKVGCIFTYMQKPEKILKKECERYSIHLLGLYFEQQGNIEEVLSKQCFTKINGIEGFKGVRESVKHPPLKSMRA